MRKYVFGALVLTLLIASAAAAAFWPARRVPQPIAYPHKTHVVDNQMECLTCHVNADRSIAATIPSVTECMVCHENVKPESPEIQKLAAFAKQGEEPPWVRVVRLPSRGGGVLHAQAARESRRGVFDLPRRHGQHDGHAREHQMDDGQVHRLP